MIADYWQVMGTSNVRAMLLAIDIVVFPPRVGVTSAARYEPS